MSKIMNREELLSKLGQLFQCSIQEVFFCLNQNQLETLANFIDTDMTIYPKIIDDISQCLNQNPTITTETDAVTNTDEEFLLLEVILKFYDYFLKGVAGNKPGKYTEKITKLLDILQIPENKFVPSPIMMQIVTDGLFLVYNNCLSEN